MPVTPRAEALRAALEDALTATVDLTASDGVTRLSAPAPPGTDNPTWRRVIQALGTADAWGSSETDGTPHIWAEINEG